MLDVLVLPIEARKGEGYYYYDRLLLKLKLDRLLFIDDLATPIVILLVNGNCS